MRMVYPQIELEKARRELRRERAIQWAIKVGLLGFIGLMYWVVMFRD